MLVTKADAEYIETAVAAVGVPLTGRFAKTKIVNLIDAHDALKRDAEHLEALAMNAERDRDAVIRRSRYHGKTAPEWREHYLRMRDERHEARAAFEQSERERNDYARRLKAANADYIAVTKERDELKAAATELKPATLIVGDRVRFTGEQGDGARCVAKMGATGTVTHVDAERNRFSVFFDTGSFVNILWGAPQCELDGVGLKKL